MNGQLHALDSSYNLSDGLKRRRWTLMWRPLVIADEIHFVLRVPVRSESAFSPCAFSAVRH